MVLCFPCRPWPAGIPLESRTRSPSGWPGTRCRSPPSVSAAATSSRTWPSVSVQPGSTRNSAQPGLTRTTASPERVACPATTSTSRCGHGTVAICLAPASCGAYYGPLRCGKASAWAPVTTTRRRPATFSTFSRDRTGTRARTGWPTRTPALTTPGPRRAGSRRRLRPDRLPCRGSGSGPPGARLATPAGGI
jgi:hypothetical protein